MGTLALTWVMGSAFLFIMTTSTKSLSRLMAELCLVFLAAVLILSVVGLAVLILSRCSTVPSLTDDAGTTQYYCPSTPTTRN